MKRFETFLRSVLLYAGAAGAILLIACGISYAKIGEAEVSGSYTDTDTGSAAAAIGGVYAPFGKFLVGPAGQFKYVNEDGSKSEAGYAGGVVVEWHVTSNERGLIPFLRTEAFKWFGDLSDTLDYQVSVGGGFKLGDDATAFKFTIVRTFIEANDNELTEARIGFVWRL